MPMRPCLGSDLWPAGHVLVRDAARCAVCVKAKDRARGTTTQRGLGWQHQQQRRAQLAGKPYCGRCGHTGSPDNPLTGEHGVPRAHGGREVTETLCLVCNSAIGASIRTR